MSEQIGYIYILTNPSFPTYVKIGYANDVASRLKQLNRSECTPFSFRVYATYQVNSRLSDKKIHEIIDKLNPDLRSIETIENKKRVREFYAMSPQDAYDLFKAIAEIHGYENRLTLVAPDNREELEEQTAEKLEMEIIEKKSKISLQKCGIEVGEYIDFIHNQDVRCKVLGVRTIEYQGKEWTMSSLAKKLLDKRSISGTLHFAYKGEVISDLRYRLECEGKYI